MYRRVLSPGKRFRIVALCEEGLSTRRIARRLNVGQSDVVRCWSRFLTTGSVEDRPRSGRPRCTTRNEDRYIALTARREPHSTAGDYRRQLQQATGTTVSDQTVRNRLHDINLHARRPLRCPPLTRDRRRLRLQWARAHEHWLLPEWSNCLFSDETRFALVPDNYRLRVWRVPGRPSRLRYPSQRAQQHGGSIMFWAGIMHGTRTDILHIQGTMTADLYLNQVLQPVVRPLARRHGDNFMLVDDNARPHRARMVTDYLRDAEIERMDWPPYSPDMNPIEHVWDMLHRAIQRRPNVPSTIPELREAAIEEWQNLPQEDINHLILRMPVRVQALIRARGGSTEY